VTNDGELVLVIDDSEIYRYFARATLQSAGYRVALAASATDGLQLVNERKPHIVCIDQHLPDGNSTTVATALRQSMAQFSCAIVALSGSSAEQTRRQALDAGAHVFLEKDPSAHSLLAAVRTASARSRSGRA